MSEPESPEILDVAERRPARRGWLVAVAAGALVLAIGAIVIPRLGGDSSHGTTAGATAKARHDALIRALTNEVTARTDAQHFDSFVDLTSLARHHLPQSPDEVSRYLVEQTGSDLSARLSTGDSVAWYFDDGKDAVVFCVEHQSKGKPDAYAVFDSAYGAVTATDHGHGCPAAAADYAATHAAAVADAP